MEIKLWSNFNKRRNSTKQPSDASATTKNVTLKESTSIENPTFILTSTTAPEWNYVKAFGHYYFVTDIISSTHSIWEIRCEQDVLATHKSAIGSTSAFIMYGSAGYDPYIADTRVSMKSQNDYDEPNSFSFDLLNNTGSFILTVGNYLGGDFGACSHYVLNKTNMGNLVQQLMGNDSLIDSLERQFKSAFSSIIKCIWIPVSFPEASYPQDEIVALGNIGLIASGDLPAVRGYRLKINPSADDTIRVNTNPYTIYVPDVNADFRDVEPYSFANLFIPYYGVINISLADYVGSEYIHISASIDVVSGDVTLLFSRDNFTYVNSINFNIATNLPLAQIISDAKGTITSAIGLAGSAIGMGASIATGQPFGIAASAAGLIGSVNSMITSANTESISVRGGIDGRPFKSFGTNFVFSVKHIETIEMDDDYISKNGRPVMKVGTISSFGPYIQCSGASVSLVSLASDRDAVNSFLNSGFYYE